MILFDPCATHTMTMENPMTTVRRMLHLETAAEYKEQTEGLIAALRAEAAALHGKEHHKERTARGKAIAELRAQPRYIDACRVAKGVPPVNGFFASEAGTGHPTVDLDSKEAARLAAEAEAALRNIEEETGSGERKAASEGPPPATPADGGADGVGDADEMERRLLLGWRRRATRLEAKLTEPVEAPPKVAADRDELEHIAQEVVTYRQKLKQQCGYRNKDLKENRDLQLLEARLDTLAGAFLPEEEEEQVELEIEAEELRQWERRLMAKLAQRTQSFSGLKPSAAREVERLLGEIAELKASLSAQGFTEHEQDRDESVLMRLVRVAELRQYEHRDKKQERKERQELEGIRAEVEQLVRKLEAHKRRLRQEKGLSQKDLKQDPEVCELEERLLTLQRMGGA